MRAAGLVCHSRNSWRCLWWRPLGGSTAVSLRDPPPPALLLTPPHTPCRSLAAAGGRTGWGGERGGREVGGKGRREQVGAGNYLAWRQRGAAGRRRQLGSSLVSPVAPATS